jgi:hypothetical protein
MPALIGIDGDRQSVEAAMPRQDSHRATITSLVLVAALCVPVPLAALANPNVNYLCAMAQDQATRQRVLELQASRSEVEVKLSRGVRVRGHILWAYDGSFALRATDRQEWMWTYAEIAGIKGVGLSWRWKLAIIGGVGTLLVLCFAPFPVGLLCQKDPS